MEDAESIKLTGLKVKSGGLAADSLYYLGSGIIEEVIDEKEISIIVSEQPHEASKEVKNFFGIGKQI